MSVDILDRVYDAYMGEMGQHFMRETQRRIHWMCTSVRGESVLDVGCSQGLVPILLGREGKSVVGIDTSPASIRTADERLVSEQVNVRKRVSFVEGDFAVHGFDGASFDCVVMGEVLEHLLEPERFIEAASRVLSPGGRLVITVPFGINDHIDHKRTYYLLEPLRLIAEHFELVEVAILGKWLGLIASRRTAREPEASANWSEQLIRSLEQAFYQIERELVDELASVRSRLDDANVKYRSSSEELTKLKREAAHNENERKSAERARAQVEQQLLHATTPGKSADAESRKELTELRAELVTQRDAAHARELNVVRMEERLAHSGQVTALELSLRDSEITRLRANEVRLNTAVEQEKRAAERYESELGRLQVEAAAMAERARAAAEQAASLQVRTAQLAEQLQTSQQALAAKKQEATELAESLNAQLEVGRVERAESTELRRRLSEAEAAVSRSAALEGELQQAQQNLRELEASNAQAREAAARERELLKRRLAETESAQARQRDAFSEAERKATQAKQQLASANQAERKAARQLEQERRGRATAERKILQTRNTLSFQLGYELIHGFKSRERLMTLPSTLWSLQKEALRRRSERALRQVPLVAVASSTPQASKLERPTLPTISMEPQQRPAAPPPEPNRVQHATSAAAVQPPAKRRLPRLDAGVAELRVACIHDEFTFSSYNPECRLLPLTPANFRQELEAFDPELLFVESAWRGEGDLWSNKISHRGHELLAVVEWCRARGIPTIFWNKEDPVHFFTFLNTAKLFDFVFTTDFDCIGRYKQALGHDRVYLLPFACQPAHHNPIEKFLRKDALCFAGAYYARYPERQQDLASIALNFTEAPRLEIFDRNFGKNDPNYAFPEEYRQFIVGTLPFDEIDRAYKGYRYALNLNSIKESQSMFARRLYELLGSNTITVSNFSRGIRLLFGDLVIATDSGERARERLLGLTANESQARRFRLAGVRKIMREHTYGERLRFVASRVWDRQVPDGLPPITVLALVRNQDALRSVLTSFERQTYSNATLLLVTSDNVELPVSTSGAQVRTIAPEKAAQSRLSDLTPVGSFIAAFSADDYHGKNYLLDLALATKYTKAPVIGKRARYVSRANGVPALEHDGAQYRTTTSLPAYASLIRRDVIADYMLGDWLSSLADRQIERSDCLAIDEFNYCQAGARLTVEQTFAVDDLKGLDEGISLAELLGVAPGRAAAPRAVSTRPAISAERLASVFKAPVGKPVALSLQNGALLVESGLPDETHEYIYANQMWRLSELGLPHSDRLHLEATPGLNLHMAILFLDENKQRLAHKLCPAGRNETATPPEGAAYVQLGLRIYGSGTSKISEFLLDHVAQTPESILGRSDYLLLTNHYPSDNDLYRNGFVHRRVVDYRRRGTRVDVFRHRKGEKLGHREFDGVDVISGDDDALAAVLRSNDYKAVLVHFLSPDMWQALRNEDRSARLLIWVHGAEIKAWHRRRDFDHSSDIDREAAKLQSTKRDAFWQQVLQQLPKDGKIIFVSRQFADQTLSDLGLPRDHEQCTVIHNLIDGSLFAYHPKSPEQRKRVLSIRPFASRTYGNDLSVAAILELRKKPYFDDLSFHLVGDGPLFDTIVEPLRGLSNVRLDKGFVTQQEIAQLHRDYGIFLCPTRDDTQGVSRDEAMASGLVPVTTRVAAVPEFVDEGCAVLAEPESHVGLADGIARLYEDPAAFIRLSEKAAQRARRQSGPEQTTERELALILGRSS